MIDQLDFMQKAVEGSEIDLSGGVVLMREIGEEFGLRGKGSEQVIEEIFETRGLFAKICEDILSKLGCSLSEANPLATKLRKSRSVQVFTQEAVEGGNGVDTEQFFAAFVALARKLFAILFESERSSQQKSSESSECACVELSGNPEFLKLVRRNKVFNWLVAVGLMEPTEYDLLQQIGGDGAYNFFTNQAPNGFAKDVVDYKNGVNGQARIIDGNTVLDLGSGDKTDGKLFAESGAKEVFLVDESSFMIERQREIRAALKRALRPGFHVPEKPQDMFEVLEQMKAAGEQMNTIYGHSVTHYFDDSTLRRLFELVNDCLVEGGHFAFAVKAPGALHDGNGIPLIIDEEQQTFAENPLEAGPPLNVRGWLNEDGQPRFFRPLDRLIAMVTDIGLTGEGEFMFDLRVGGTSVIENYDLSGKEQTFYEIILKKVRKPEKD